jgi:ribonuclease HII
MRVAGVDEAGRGCVIGPLVITGVLFEAETLPTLKELGVRDSKKLTVKKRNILAEEIRKLAVNIETFELQPIVIDKVVLRGKYLRRLNYLETMVMARIIRKLKPDVVYVDSPDVDSERCMSQIKFVIDSDLNVVCEHKADDTYLSTGAASIIAKVIRDERVAKLRELHGDFNSGYAHDQKTQEFIAEYFSKHKVCPDFIRGSWVTVQRHLNPLKQKKLESSHDLSQKDQE